MKCYFLVEQTTTPGPGIKKFCKRNGAGYICFMKALKIAIYPAPWRRVELNWELYRETPQLQFYRVWGKTKEIHLQKIIVRKNNAWRLLKANFSYKPDNAEKIVPLITSAIDQLLKERPQEYVHPKNDHIQRRSRTDDELLRGYKPLRG